MSTADDLKGTSNRPSIPTRFDVVTRLLPEGHYGQVPVYSLTDLHAYGEACAAEEHKRMNAVLAAQSAAHHREVQEQVAAEREACAMVCEEQALSDENCKCPFAVSGWWPDQVTYRCAAAIRARGKT